jgi:hypothetical protein
MTTIEDTLRRALADRAALATRSFGLDDVIGETLMPIATVGAARRRRRPLIIGALATAAAIVTTIAVVANGHRPGRVDVSKNPPSTTSSSETPSSTPTPPSTTAPVATTSDDFRPKRFDPTSLPSGWSVGYINEYTGGQLPSSLAGDTLLIAGEKTDGTGSLTVLATRSLLQHWAFGDDPAAEAARGIRQVTVHGVAASASITEPDKTGYLLWVEGDIVVSLVVKATTAPTVEELATIGEQLIVSQQEPYASVRALTGVRATYEGRGEENLASYEMAVTRENLKQAEDDSITIHVGSAAPQIAMYNPNPTRTEEHDGRRFEIFEGPSAIVATPFGSQRPTQTVRFREGDTLVRMQGNMSIDDLVAAGRALRVTDEPTFLAHTKSVTRFPEPTTGKPFDLSRPGVVRIRGESGGLRWNLLADPANPDGRYSCVQGGADFGGCTPTPIRATAELPFVASPTIVASTDTGLVAAIYGLAQTDVAQVRIITSDGRSIATTATVRPMLGPVRGFAATFRPTTKVGTLTVTALSANGEILGKPVTATTEAIDQAIDNAASQNQIPPDLLVPWGPVVQEGTVDGVPWKLHGTVQLSNRVCAAVEFGASGSGFMNSGPDICEWDRANFGDPPRPVPGILYADLLETRRRFVGVVVEPDITSVRFEFAEGTIDSPVPATTTNMRVVAVGVPKTGTLTAVSALRADGSVAGRMVTNVGGESTQQYILPSKYTPWNQPSCLSANAPIVEVARQNGQTVPVCPK